MASQSKRFVFPLIIGLGLLTIAANVAKGDFEVRVVDAQTKKMVSVRMSIRNARGALIKQRGVPYYAGSFCFFGKHTFKLPRGVYAYVVEKGLEYKTVTGKFEIKRDANDGVTVEIPRFTNLPEKGWWSGDLQIRRPIRDAAILMDANDLHFGIVIAQSNDGVTAKDGFPKTAYQKVNDKISFCPTGIADIRLGGGLTYAGAKKEFKLPGPLSLTPLAREVTSPEIFAFVDNAAAWDLPVLLAAHAKGQGKLNGIGIAGNVVSPQSYSKKRKELYPPAKTLASDHPMEQWQTRIYYHALNCGFQIPPVGSSGSGQAKSPVGYNRTYVHIGKKYDAKTWLDNLQKGRVVVTNGPVMNVLFNGVLPGETFQIAKGKSLEVETTLSLSLKEKAEYLEIIRNGLVAEKISLDEYAKQRGRLPKITFTESGWMLVRVVTNNKDAYRFASSGPIYVEIGNQPILKKESAKFFLDWIVERAKMINGSTAPNKKEIVEKMRPAFEFWKSKSS